MFESTAEVLAQLARELDAQTMTTPLEEVKDWAGEIAHITPERVETVPVFSRETRDRIVIEVARVYAADGVTLRGE